MNTLDSSIDLKDFSKRAFEALGAVVEDQGVIGLDVLLSDDCVSYFQSGDLLQLSFSSQEAGEREGVERVTLGSPVLEGLLRFVSSKGLLARAYLNPLHVETGNVEEKFARRFSWENAKPYLKSTSLEETAHACFQFKVSFLSDDKIERLCPVLINLTTFLEQDHLLREWDHLFFERERFYEVTPASFSLVDLERAFGQAALYLKNKISPEIKKMKTFQEKLLSRDLSRIEDYYGEFFREIGKKEARAEGDSVLLDKIRKRKKAVELDREKKLKDAVEKYRLEVRAETVNLLILYQPWMRCVFDFKTRTGDFERVFYWDPVMKDFFDDACEECLVPRNRFVIRDRKFICPQCKEVKVGNIGMANIQS